MSYLGGGCTLITVITIINISLRISWDTLLLDLKYHDTHFENVLLLDHAVFWLLVSACVTPQN